MLSVPSNSNKDMPWHVMQRQVFCSLVCCAMNDARKGRTEETIAGEALVCSAMRQGRASSKIAGSGILSLYLKIKNVAGSFRVLCTRRLQFKEICQRRKYLFLQTIILCLYAFILSVLFYVHAILYMKKHLYILHICRKNTHRIRAPD